MLAAYFGTDEVRFTSTSEGTPGVVRAYPGFAAAADEAGISRIYGGIHWDCDNVDGLACGKHVGEYVARQFLGRAEPEADEVIDPVHLAKHSSGRALSPIQPAEQRRANRRLRYQAYHCIWAWVPNSRRFRLTSPIFFMAVSSPPL